MKKIIRISTLYLITILLCFMFVNTRTGFAKNLPPKKASPPEYIIRNATPIGGGKIITPVKNHNRTVNNILYSYYFDGIYNRYDGYYDRGIIEIAGPNNTSSVNTSTYTISRTVGNSFSTQIGADADFVSAHVGYNVKFSTEKSWAYTVTVPPGKTIYLHYRDWYHVQEFNCHKHYWLTGSNVYGTGWAAQWFAPQFYTTEG